MLMVNCPFLSPFIPTNSIHKPPALLVVADFKQQLAIHPQIFYTYPHGSVLATILAEPNGT
jgi:hypothetical protein